MRLLGLWIITTLTLIYVAVAMSQGAILALILLLVTLPVYVLGILTLINGE